ncbi:MAG: RluA family pseudouridine synthase [Alkaliphilus sp.]
MLSKNGQTENVLLYDVENEDINYTLKKILKKKLNFSSRLLSKIKREKNIYVNGVYARYHQVLNKGDQIKVLMNEEPNQFIAQNIPLLVVYEDCDIIIINKQPGIVTHPTKGHVDCTIANAATYYMQTNKKEYRIRFINRLDMNTSGLLIIAKNPYAQHVVSLQMKEDKVKKKYIAFVKGIVVEDEEAIDAPIYKEAEDSIKRTVDGRGAASLTKYKVIERYNNATKLEIELLTGRTHQIRVHVAHIGHAIIGDGLYGEEKDERINRQALHATYLKMHKARGNEPIEVEALLPKDLLILQKKLEDEMQVVR